MVPFCNYFRKTGNGGRCTGSDSYVNILFTLCSLFVRFLFTLGAHFVLTRVLTKCSLGAYYGSCWAAGRPGSTFAGQWVIPKDVHHTILYYTILYYTILYTTILSSTILYYTIQYCTILCYTILYFTILYYTMLYHAIFTPGPHP